MVGNNSNIYVSVTGPQANGQHEGYRRAQHLWIISIEPHHTHIPGTARKDHEPLHYIATRNPENGTYTLKTYEISDGPGIIGNILVVESANTSSGRLREFLEQDLGPTPPNSDSIVRESSDEPEHWIRHAIHGLQKRKIIDTFEVDEFITFAHGYLANRLENEAPALILYPKLHKDHEKKSSKHKFWISNPMAERTHKDHSGTALKYGGLM